MNARLLRSIVTEHRNPPVQVRGEGYEPGDSVGYGATEQEAIDWLIAEEAHLIARARDIREACSDMRDAMGNPVISGTMDQTLHGQTIRTAIAQLHALLPCSYYLDPPDGGEVPLFEQLPQVARASRAYPACNRVLRGLAMNADVHFACANDFMLALAIVCVLLAYTGVLN